jgi:hypothetical protein
MLGGELSAIADSEKLGFLIRAVHNMHEQPRRALST